MSQTISMPPALKGLFPPALLRALDEHSRLVVLRRGQVILGHQDTTNDVFLVLEGSLRVELHSLQGREIILADLGPGELFGELAAIDELPRSATVSSTEPSRLLSLSGKVFRSAVFADPDAAGWLARRLVRQIRLMDERNFELNALAVRNRLHCELLRLGLDAGLHGNRAVLAPSPTHAELAGRIGTHREAVTRELQYLQEQGIVAKRGRELAVEDVARLVDVVQAASGGSDLVKRAAATMAEAESPQA